MLSDSDFSMASVDTNPTFDQFDDGGSSVDYSSLVNAGAQIGMEIAGAMSGGSSAPMYAQATPMPANLSPTKANNTAQIVLLIILVGGGVWWFMSSASG